MIISEYDKLIHNTRERERERLAVFMKRDGVVSEFYRDPITANRVILIAVTIKSKRWMTVQHFTAYEYAEMEPWEIREAIETEAIKIFNIYKFYTVGEV